MNLNFSYYSDLTESDSFFRAAMCSRNSNMIKWFVTFKLLDFY